MILQRRAIYSALFFVMTLLASAGLILIQQAEFLAPHVHPHLQIPHRGRVLEVGCGVGSQTRLLCRARPDLRVHAIDRMQTRVS